MSIASGNREQTLAEKQECGELRRKIMAMTDRIPYHVSNGSAQTAAAFKEHATKARRWAEHRVYSQSVFKMREAFNLISGYYQGK